MMTKLDYVAVADTDFTSPAKVASNVYFVDWAKLQEALKPSLLM